MEWEGNYLCQGQEGRGSNDVGYHPRARNFTTTFSSRASGRWNFIHWFLKRVGRFGGRRFYGLYSKIPSVVVVRGKLDNTIWTSVEDSSRQGTIGLCLSLAWISVEVRMSVTTQEQSIWFQRQVQMLLVCVCKRNASSIVSTNVWAGFLLQKTPLWFWNSKIHTIWSFGRDSVEWSRMGDALWDSFTLFDQDRVTLQTVKWSQTGEEWNGDRREWVWYSLKFCQGWKDRGGIGRQEEIRIVEHPFSTGWLVQ